MRAIESLRTMWSRSPQAIVGLGLVVLVAGMALLAPWIAPYDPTSMALGNRFAGPSWSHLLGTDEFGRDILSRIIYGGRASLLISGGAVTLATLIGSSVGGLSGYFGGALDLLLMRVSDIFLAIPALMVAMGVVGLLGPTATTVAVALGVAYSAPFARVVRSAVISVRVQPYVEASRVLGASTWRIYAQDIIPNILPIVAVQITTVIAFGILDEASLGFLGLGIQPPEPSWGSMLTTGRQYMFQSPNIALFAGAAVLIAVLGFNFFGDGLRDRLDPRDWARLS